MIVIKKMKAYSNNITSFIKLAFLGIRFLHAKCNRDIDLLISLEKHLLAESFLVIMGCLGSYGVG